MVSEMVSVIIPTYKRPEMLKRAIESVLSQSYANIEIIVVDDNSGDDTGKTVENYGDRITFLKNTRTSGGAETRNRGIGVSNGKYIAFLDDDDVWNSEKIALQVNELETNPDAVLCTCGLRVVYEKSGLQYYNFPGLNNTGFKDMLLNNRVGITSTVMVKRSALDRSGWFDPDLPARQDYDLWIRLSKEGSFRSVNRPLVDYYMHGSKSQISSNIKKYMKANEIIRNKHSEFYEKFNSSELNILKADNFFQYSTIAINNNKRLSALKYILRSIIFKPSLRNIVLIFAYIAGKRSYILIKQIYGKRQKRRYEQI